ncbi:WD40 domain protein [Cotonvirus japonicus]|uniref:WD40 domain protein n=1 Tax=Cotonvirus japonicus TaxID=2811091 RepID=A0ABM7NTW8_9VIRU|nr:WD40 domain protein [Cotonvirus japonicus]BCS83569.1 WD40 domain protein [Cotonvirus japonicus]
MQLSIVLVDNVQEIKISVKHDILAQSCTYFTNLLTKFQEQNSTIIKLTVPYAKIAADIIEQLSNSDSIINDSLDVEYQLKFYKTCVFFGIEIDHEFLQNIKVPHQHFDLLLDIIDIIGYDEHTIKIVIDNLPLDYDLSTFPKSLIDEMYTISTSYKIIAGTNFGDIQLWDPDTRMLLNNNSIDCTRLWEIYYVLDGSVIIRNNTNNVYTYNLNNHKITEIYKISCETRFHISYSSANKHLAITDDKKIIIKNLIDNTNIKIIKYKKDCSRPFYSPNNKYFAVSNIDGITIYDGLSYKFKKNIYQIGNSCCAFSHDNKIIAIGSQDSNIYIYEIKNGKLKMTLSQHRGSVMNISFSKDGLWMVSIAECARINIWNTTTMMLHCYINNYNDLTQIKFTPDCNQIIVSSYGYIHIYDVRSGELMDIFDDYDGDNTFKLEYSDSEISVDYKYDKNVLSIDIIQNFDDEIINKIKNYMNYN